MCERLSDEQKLECSGGFGCCPFREKELTYADKGSHKERSLFNSPVHLKHKEKKFYINNQEYKQP